MADQKKGNPWMLIAILMAVLFLVFVLCGGGLLVAIAVPGFLRAREVSRKNSCQENQVRLDAVLQQYMLENNFEDIGSAATPANLGTLAQLAPGDGAWAGVLIGDDAYLRQAPQCPSGGLYAIVPYGDGPPVACSLSVRDTDEAFWHTYPE